MVWYRVRVSESQWHTPTQKYTEYLPRGDILPDFLLLDHFTVVLYVLRLRVKMRLELTLF